MSDSTVRPADLFKSKFDVSSNYLWNRCGYFQESNEQFYISQFIEFDKLLTSNKPNQVFVEKITNKVIVISWLRYIDLSFFIITSWNSFQVFSSRS